MESIRKILNKDRRDGNMNIINYISSAAIPVSILLIIVYGVIEKQKVFDVFIEGVKEGIQIVVSIFPNLLGLFIAIGALRTSGILDVLINIISPVIEVLNIPSQIIPLALLRPISGSASMAVAIDIMKNCGVDSLIGMITSTIMGSTETTLYTIAIYTSVTKIKKTRFVLKAALIGDIVGILTSVIIWQIMS